MVRVPEVPNTVPTSTDNFGSFKKNFHTQSGCVVGQAGVGMMSWACWAASSKMMVAVDEVAAALQSAPPTVALRATNDMTELSITAMRFILAPLIGHIGRIHLVGAWERQPSPLMPAHLGTVILSDPLRDQPVATNRSSITP